MLASFQESLRAAFVALFILSLSLGAHAQSGSSTSLSGNVVDSSGAVIPNAAVEIHNPVSAFARSTTTDSAGNFSFPNVPFNPYHLSVTANGFSPFSQDVDVRSLVAVNVSIHLKVAGSSESVTVETGGDLVENDPTGHTEIGRASCRERV